MSRQGTAWSVKGIDQATRDIARRASQAAGLTIGEWIDQAIRADAESRGEPSDSPSEQAAQDPRPGTGMVAPDPSGGGRSATAVAGRVSLNTVDALAERLDAADARLDAAMRPIGFALQNIAARLVALEERADTPAKSLRGPAWDRPDVVGSPAPEPQVAEPQAAGGWLPEAPDPQPPTDDFPVDELPVDYRLPADPDPDPDEPDIPDPDISEPAAVEPAVAGPAVPEPAIREPEIPGGAEAQTPIGGAEAPGRDDMDRDAPVSPDPPPRDPAPSGPVSHEAEPGPFSETASSSPAGRSLPEAPPSDWEPVVWLRRGELAREAEAMRVEPSAVVELDTVSTPVPEGEGAEDPQSGAAPPAGAPSQEPAPEDWLEEPDAGPAEEGAVADRIAEQEMPEDETAGSQAAADRPLREPLAVGPALDDQDDSIRFPESDDPVAAAAPEVAAHEATEPDPTEPEAAETEISERLDEPEPERMAEPPAAPARPEPVPPTGDLPADAPFEGSVPNWLIRRPAAPSTAEPVARSAEPQPESVTHAPPMDAADALPPMESMPIPEPWSRTEARSPVADPLTRFHPSAPRRSGRRSLAAAAAIALLLGVPAVWWFATGGGMPTLDAVRDRLAASADSLRSGAELGYRRAGVEIEQLLERINPSEVAESESAPQVAAKPAEVVPADPGPVDPVEAEPAPVPAAPAREPTPSAAQPDAIQEPEPRVATLPAAEPAPAPAVPPGRPRAQVPATATAPSHSPTVAPALVPVPSIGAPSAPVPSTTAPAVTAPPASVPPVSAPPVSVPPVSAGSATPAVSSPAATVMAPATTAPAAPVAGPIAGPATVPAPVPVPAPATEVTTAAASPAPSSPAPSTAASPSLSAPPPAPPLPPAVEPARPVAEIQVAETQAVGAQVASAPAAVDPVGSVDDATLLAEARSGDPRAQYTLATRLAAAAEPDYPKAANWFRESAIQGLPNAQYNLGVLYERGLGVPQDDTRALLWYHSAAEQGHPLAQYNLGVLYSAGRGIPLSYAEAARWFQRAADRDVPAAIYNLSILTEGGLGVQRDPATAEELLRRAAELGHPGARARLRAGGTSADTGSLDETADTAVDGIVTEDVVVIQRGLRRLGLYDGPVDGIAGPRTREAIGRYQRQEGLPITGMPSGNLKLRLVPRDSSG